MALLSRLQKRNLQPEWMDRPDLDETLHHQALRGLARINWWSGSARILWPALARLAARTPDHPLRVLDVATGSGDVPCALWQRAHRAGISLRLQGCDVSEVALRTARQRAAQRGVTIDFFTHDILKDALPTSYDAIVCSLFLHHLTEADALTFLQRLGQSARVVLINDLVRGRWGYMLAWLGTRCLSRSPVVQLDGPRSVEGAFTPAEALALAHQAGLLGATVQRRWPCRYLLEWHRPEASS